MMDLLKRELTKCIHDGEVKADISGMLEEIKKLEVESGTTRFMLVLGVREDGSLYTQSDGEISELEAEGMRCFIDAAIDGVISSIGME